MGMEWVLLVTTRPMSSANARRVESPGSNLVSWSISISIHSTNSVGDKGHPWRTPREQGK